MRTRVKLCGITRPDDASFAVQHGVDAIGMILYANSPRLIETKRAKQIRAQVPAFVTLVGVFVDASKIFIDQMCEEVGLDLVQLHGNESNAFGESLNTPFIKAIRAKNPEQVSHDVCQFPSARGHLLDPYVKGQSGGTGKQLDHQCWPDDSHQAMILAGGLSPANLSASLRRFQPFAVDLNSGVESSPGVKDPELLAQAMQLVQAHHG